MTNEEEKNKKHGVVYWILVASIVGATMPKIIDYVKGITPIYVPTTTKVERNSVIPSNLEIKCKDINRNGLCETIVNYDGKQFVLRYDGNEIVGSQFEVKPPEVVPK